MGLASATYPRGLDTLLEPVLSVRNNAPYNEILLGDDDSGGILLNP